VKYYEIVSYGGSSVLNGLTCQQFLNMPRTILSSVLSILKLTTQYGYSSRNKWFLIRSRYPRSYGTRMHITV